MTGLQAMLLAITVTVTPPRPMDDSEIATGAQIYHGAYTLALAGVPLAQSRFESILDGNRFTIRGKASSAGLASLFDSTAGNTKVSGRFVGDRARPDRFDLQYKSGDQTRVTKVSFVNGAAAKTTNTPASRKPKNWIAVKPDDLRQVHDPLSATLIRTDDPNQVCSRVLRIYDGQFRMDLVLSPESAGPVPGYDGEAVTCSAQFVPVSGYQSTNRSIRYVKENAKISISFAEFGETGIYAPVRATIGTMIGTLTVSATHTKG